jgi:hypothetical protein
VSDLVYILVATVLGTVLAAYVFGFDVIAGVGVTLLRAAGLQ